MPDIRVLATGLEFPEGPVVMPDGSVVLVEIRGQRLTRVWPDGAKEVVASIPGGPNGAAIGPDGKCYLCNNGGFSWMPSRGTMMPGAPFDLAAPGEVRPRDVIYRGERGKPIAGLGGYQMFDSLAVEASGNICVATLVSGCITVIAPDGGIVEQVPTGDRVTTNIAFGGPELKTACITLSGKGELVAMDWARPGLPLNFLNK
jgi:sugar lactone lactonase YvrE